MLTLLHTGGGGGDSGDSTDSDSDDSSAGPIVGGVIGGLVAFVVIAVLITVICYFVISRRKKGKVYSRHTYMNKIVLKNST